MSNEQIQTVEFQPYGSTSVASGGEKPRKQWFANKSDGYHGKPIELDGEFFYYRQLKKSDVRAYVKGSRNLQREAKKLEQQQTQEIEQLRTEAKRNGHDESAVELSDERLEFYDGEGDRIADELNTLYLELLQKGLVGWSLEEKFTPALLADFSQEDKVSLCQELATRSTAGISPAKN